MKRIVKIEGVGNVVFPDSMSDREVSEVAGRLYDDANPARKRSKATGVAASATDGMNADQDTSGWQHIQSSGKHYLIHPEDLEKAKKRDPNLIIHDQ